MSSETPRESPPLVKRRLRHGSPNAAPARAALAAAQRFLPATMLLFALVACDGATPTPTVDPTGPLRLDLTVTPLEGDAPLVVRVEAELVGELGPGDDVRFRCATAAFIMGDDTVQHVPPEQPCSNTVQRRYESAHTYQVAGTFPVSVRLIARPVRPSPAQRIFVRGATPTPVPLGAAPGPTIIIATPAARTPTAVAVAEGGDVEGSAEASRAAPASATPAATAIVSQTPRPAGPATQVAVAATPVEGINVLPADLYFLAGAPARLARLPASGEAPEAVGPPIDRSVDDFAISSLGLVARVAGGELAVLSPLGEARQVAATGASHPVWSRDGRMLAFSLEGELQLFDVVSFSEEALGIAGRPLAFSFDGDWLLARDAAGELQLLRPEERPVGRLPLPLSDAAHAGWLPGREVLWLSGPGLRFVSLDDTISVIPVLDESVETSSVFVRPDQRALLLAERGGAATLHLVDLTAPTLEAEVVGVPLVLPLTADFTWSPDGRWLAVAGPSRLVQFSPVTGLSSSLVEGAVRRPEWVLSGR